MLSSLPLTLQLLFVNARISPTEHVLTGQNGNASVISNTVHFHPLPGDEQIEQIGKCPSPGTNEPMKCLTV